MTAVPERRRRVSRRQLLHIERDLSDRERAVLGSVERFHFLTTGQLQLLHFTDHASSASAGRVCRRALHRLADLRVIEALERRIGGIRAGSAAYIWRVGPIGDRLLRDATDGPARRKEPSPRLLDHTLAVAACYCELVVAARQGAIELLEATPEPGSWRRYLGPGGSREVLKPDLHAVTASGEYEDHWFVEVDRATESLPTVLKQCALYEAYRRTGQEQAARGVFPRVLWVVPDERRATQLRSAIGRARQLDLDLFRVTTVDDLLAGMRSH
jgi:hypothetical protein